MPKTVIMKKKKDCKHSVAYEVEPESDVRHDRTRPEQPLDSVYVKRAAFPEGMPERIEITVKGLSS